MMTREELKDAIEEICEQIHWKLGEKLLEILDTMNVEDGAYDPRIFTAAAKFLADNNISLESGHYDEAPVEPGGVDGDEPLMGKLGKKVLPWAKGKRVKKDDESATA